MNLEEGCHSLKLECALRDLGFVDIDGSVLHTQVYFLYNQLVFQMIQREIFLDFILQFHTQEIIRKLRCCQPQKKHLIGP